MSGMMIIIGLLLYAGVLAILGKTLWENMTLKEKVSHLEAEKQYLIFKRGIQMLDGVLRLVESNGISFPFALSQYEIEMLYKISRKLVEKDVVKL